MISIQELGLSILSDSPKPLYIIGGTEYGVKDKYIEHLKKLYGAFSESTSTEDIVALLSAKRLVPIPRQLFIVRYDEAFVSNMSESYASKIKKLKIPGTIVCVYDQDKHIAKLDKYLPEFTAVVEGVDKKFILKYLKSDFPKLDDRSLRIAAQACYNYSHARNICKSFSAATPEALASISEDALIRLVGCSETSSEKDIQISIAKRDFRSLVTALDMYPDDKESLIYTVLQTMIELEKVKSSKYVDSPLKEFASNWKPEDIYYMFMNAYSVLLEMRSNAASDITSRLIYLFSLLTFQSIPSVEVMNAL